MTDFKKILRKRKWSGRELGQLEVASANDLIVQSLKGNKDPAPIVAPDRLREMVLTLNEEQMRDYNEYVALHEFLNFRFNVANAYDQQAQAQFKTVASFLTVAMLEADAYSIIARLPRIYTEKQYREELDARLEQILAEGNSSAMELIYRAIDFYVEELCGNPHAENPLTPIKNIYEQELLTSDLVLSRYNDACDEGYYVLPDGRRSDQMTNAAWEEACYTDKMRAAIANGEKDKLRRRCHHHIYFTHFASGNASQLASKSVYDLEKQWYIDEGYVLEAKWIRAEGAPRRMSKWDFLCNAEVYEVYAHAIAGGSGDTSEYSEEATDFVCEFREAIEAVLPDIERRYFSGKRVFYLNNPLTLCTTVYPYTWLYDKNYYGYKDCLQSSSLRLWDGDPRAVLNGIAVIKSQGLSLPVTKQGYYKEQIYSNSFDAFGITAFAETDTNRINNQQILETSRDLMLRSYYFLKGHNIMIDLLSEHYDVPLDGFKADLRRLEEQMDALNEPAPDIFFITEHTPHDDAQKKAEQLELISRNFPKIDYNAVQIPDCVIDQALSLMPSIQRVTVKNMLADILCLQGYTEGAEVL